MKNLLTSALALILCLDLVCSRRDFSTTSGRATSGAVGIYGIQRVEIVKVTGPHSLSEGPHWDADAQVLYFVDIPAQRLYCYDPATGLETFAFIKNGPLGVAVPVSGLRNRFVGGAGTDVVDITWDRRANDKRPKIKRIALVDQDKSRRGRTRFNDGKVDPRGRLWFGTMGLKMEPDLGTLYRMDNSTIKLILRPVTISNGLAWSHDNMTFYYIDSPTRQIVAYNYDAETGDIWDPEVLFDFDNYGLPGIPDGMTIDDEGNLWVAIYDGGRVISIDSKTGQLLRTVLMPAKQVTSVAFGGPNLDVLYVTTARQNLTDEDLRTQPQAGSVFAVRGLTVLGSSAGRPYRRVKRM